MFSTIVITLNLKVVNKLCHDMLLYAKKKKERKLFEQMTKIFLKHNELII